MVVRRVVVAVALGMALLLAVTPAAFGARAVYSSGSGTLNLSWHADFDAGILNATSGYDMKYNGLSSNDLFLDPDGIALIKLMGSRRPGYLKCKSAALSALEIRVQASMIGKWFCLKTQAGRFTRFRLDSFPPYPAGIQLTFRTWV